MANERRQSDSRGLRALRGVALLCASALLLAGCTSLVPMNESRAVSETLSVARAAQLDATLSAIADDPSMPLASLSVLVLRRGEVAYEQQFGRRYIDASERTKDLPANRDTMYRIASVSKLVTTIGVMRLVEEGTLSLDADVSIYLGWPLRNPHFPDVPVTLRQLLTHRSSLRDDAGYYWPYTTALRDVLSPQGSLYGTGATWANNAPPGAYFSYANLPWGVIGTIMERATGERFDRLMQRLVFAPLSMNGGFHPVDFSATELANTATLYRKRTQDGDREVWNPQGPWIAQVDDYRNEMAIPRAKADYVIGSNGTAFGPQGACRLSAASLGKLMRLLIDGGAVDGVRLLSATSVKAMLAREWQYDPASRNGSAAFGDARQLFNAWGLGNQQFIDVSGPQRGDRLVRGGGFTGVGHLGDAWGLTSAFVFDPASGDGVIFLTGGPGADPAPTRGEYSAFYRHEERILDALIRWLIGAD